MIIYLLLVVCLETIP